MELLLGPLGLVLIVLVLGALAGTAGKDSREGFDDNGVAARTDQG